MATRRRTSATAPRKTAKAASAPVTKSPSVKTTVTKYTQPIEIKKVTETPTPARVRPEKPNLTLLLDKIKANNKDAYYEIRFHPGVDYQIHKKFIKLDI